MEKIDDKLIKEQLQQVENRSTMLQWCDDMNARKIKPVFTLAMDDAGNVEVYSTVELPQLMKVLHTTVKVLSDNKPIQLI